MSGTSQAGGTVQAAGTIQARGTVQGPGPKPGPGTTRICDSFGRHAHRYNQQAQLQRAIAWRLARQCAHLNLPTGPSADLGAGTGLVGQALQQLAPQIALEQVDGCPQLLARNPLASRNPATRRHWDLEQGLPAGLHGAALLTSSFTLQWLNQPERHLTQWAQALAPGGWLVLAVPTKGCFPQWHGAAQRAQVPCTALPLPRSTDLLSAAAGPLRLLHGREHRFSRTYGDGPSFLRQIRQLGAGVSPNPTLSPGQWRALLRQWPASGIVSWQVLVLVGQKR